MPGCTLAAYDPTLAAKTAAYLKSRFPELGFVLTCCGKPTKLVGRSDLFEQRFGLLASELEEARADQIITACPGCLDTLGKHADAEVVSLWEVLGEIGLPPGVCGKAAGEGVEFVVHDACATRENEKVQVGVRSLIKQLGYCLNPSMIEGKNTLCCGKGGMVGASNPELSRACTHRCIEALGSTHIAVYCASCRDAFAADGAHARHLLELIWGDVVSGTDGPSAIPSPLPSLKKWRNRLKTNALLNRLQKRGSL